MQLCWVSILGLLKTQAASGQGCIDVEPRDRFVCIGHDGHASLISSKAELMIQKVREKVAECHERLAPPEIQFSKDNQNDVLPSKRGLLTSGIKKEAGPARRPA
ncbi:MAG: hypothetical protein MRY77_10645 [Rhodobacteraceae bacterium]|nr:hypothetical protein [Paracoccaceae bacterium]